MKKPFELIGERKEGLKGLIFDHAFIKVIINIMIPLNIVNYKTKDQTKHSRVPNKRGVSNKRPGWKISENLINVQALINVQGRFF